MTNDYLQTFQAELEREGKAIGTVDAYRRSLLSFCSWLEASYGETGFDPAAVTADDLRSYRSHLLTVQRHKAATVNRHLSALSRFFALAVAKGWCQQDPSDGLKAVRQIRGAPKALDRISLRRLLRAVHQGQNLRDIAILEVFVNAGLRVGELVGLQVEDLVVSERKGQVMVRGKGEKQRAVSLNRDARQAIEVYLEVRPTAPTAALFVSGQLGPLDESTVWRLVRLMGHENVTTTAIYAQATEEDLAQAVETLAVE